MAVVALLAGACVLAGCQTVYTSEDAASTVQSEPAAASTVPVQDGGTLVANDDAVDVVYAITSCSIRAFEGGTVELEWVYDANGRGLEYERRAPDGSSRTFVATQFDENGFQVDRTVTRFDALGEVERADEEHHEYLYEGDRMVQDSDGDIDTYYSYYDDGVVKLSTNSQGYENGFDEKGRKTLYDGGLANRDKGALTFSYEEDANGFVRGWTASFADGDSYRFTCDTDEHGNIVAVYDPNGERMLEASYQRIDDPCEAARVYAYTRVGTYIVVDTTEEYLGL